jgi:hypothetical protein
MFGEIKGHGGKTEFRVVFVGAAKRNRNFEQTGTNIR